MKVFKVALAVVLGMVALPVVTATTIMIVPVFEPLSLHGTDGDDAISEIGEALQATVLSRPMALTGAFPEVLVDSICSPHPIPTNNPNYEVKEVNLLTLCKIGISGEMTEAGLLVRFDVSQLKIPVEVDLTSRQVLKLAIVAIRRTLEGYQAPQPQGLPVSVVVEGTNEGTAPLKDLAVAFTVGPEVVAD